MRRAVAAAAAGDWPAAAAVGEVTLDHESRRRRRLRVGGDVLLDLPEAPRLSEGDGLRLEDGGWIAVRAADEDLAEAAADDAGLLLRLAWHLGNRHCPAEIRPGAVRIRRDRVIEDMLRGLGARVVPVRAPFEPERGAYRHGR